MIILFLPLIIYYYPYNNTEYNNNGESINVKYLHNEKLICIINFYGKVPMEFREFKPVD